MNIFQNQRKADTIRFIAMMESGEMVDERADVVQTQVIAKAARASLRNRDAVPLYHLQEENRPPVWQENVIVETGLVTAPGSDSRYCLEDSQTLWEGFKTGAVEPQGESKLKKNSVVIAMNVAAVLVFVVCGWLAGLNQAPPGVVGEETSDDTTVAGPDGAASDGQAAGIGAARAVEDNSHGFVEDLDDLEADGPSMDVATPTPTERQESTETEGGGAGPGGEGDGVEAGEVPAEYLGES